MMKHREMEDIPESIQAELYEEEEHTRRLQLIVYPSLIAFAVLASYGFYLIYSLTRDIHLMTDSIIKMTESVDRNMTVMSGDVGKMNYSMVRMTEAVTNMQRDLWSMNQNISTPLSAVNRMLPFSNNSSGPFPGSPGPMPFAPPMMRGGQQ